MSVLLVGGCSENKKSDSPQSGANVKQVNSDEYFQRLKKNILAVTKDELIDLNASNIMVVVLNSKINNVLAMVNTNSTDNKSPSNYNSHIFDEEVAMYSYEPGDIVAPIVYAIALEKSKIIPDEIINCYNGEYIIENKKITDAKQYSKLSAEDVIVYSSNIGITQIASKLSSINLYNGLKSFGLSYPSSNALYEEDIGYIPSVTKLDNSIYKATTSYGYGLKTNLLQLTRAYSVFNNQGMISDLSIAQTDNKSSCHKSKVINNSVAQLIKKSLIKSVQIGTGSVAKMEVFEIGGKTGISNMVKNNRYINRYHNTFIGFVNSTKSKYIIGVLVIDPKKNNDAGKTAAPIFNKIIELMIQNKYIDKI